MKRKDKKGKKEWKVKEGRKIEGEYEEERKDVILLVNKVENR